MRNGNCRANSFVRFEKPALQVRARAFPSALLAATLLFNAAAPSLTPAATATNPPAPAAVGPAAADSPVDLERARALMQKVRSGETLTPEEQNYLDRARQEIQKRRAQMGGTANSGQRGPGRNADMPGVRPARQPDKTFTFKQTPQGELKLYVYLPPGWKASDNRPCFVFWFGGGFAVGSPSQFYSQAEYFAGRGMVCVCPEYRVKSRHGATLDQCTEDGRSAVRWIKGHHAELGIDPARLVASGGSASGTLSLLMALGSGPDAAEDDKSISPKPSALVLYNPAQGDPVMNLIRGEGEEHERLVKLISPLNAPRPGMPPAIFFFATADRLMPFSRGFCEKSIALGNTNEFWTAADMAHGFFNRQPWHDAVVLKTDEFLAKLGYLKEQAQITPVASAVLRHELPK